MPKMKTHRGAAKRFKKTGTGKFKDFDEKHGADLPPEVALLWQPLAQRARYIRDVVKMCGPGG